MYAYMHRSINVFFLYLPKIGLEVCSIHPSIHLSVCLYIQENEHISCNWDLNLSWFSFKN